MTKPYLPPVEIRQKIHFDTLSAAALDDIRRFSPTLWTDHADHDPGVTLTQALSYAVSDLAYRHTLPITDLLTPEHSDGHAGLFPAGFGAEQVLTSSPVTEEDYRRALLDLHTTDLPGGSFLFRNAQLVRERIDEQYRYFYDSNRREFLFTADGAGQFKQMNVSGSYRLYLQLERGVSRATAEPILQGFLRNHRNLCEQVRTIDWLTGVTVHVWVTVELEDDCIDPARVMANLFEAVEAVVMPTAMRHSADELLEAGQQLEDIYSGPRLHHGWISHLPASEPSMASPSVNIAPLADTLSRIKGIKEVDWLSWYDPDNQVLELGSNLTRYNVLYGSSPLDILAQGNVVKLFKRGQQMTVTAAQIQAYLKLPTLIVEGDTNLPYSRYRKPDQYYYASQRLPPLYGLQDPTLTAAQRQLHQFLLPFEQVLVDGCMLLAKLPQLLSFQRKDDSAVWGDSKWPFPLGSLSDQAHDSYRQTLLDESARQSTEQGKELAIVDYLLGYFGQSRASRTLWAPGEEDDQLLAVQQSYLGSIGELGYDRSSIRIDRVSALQRHIAAKLGIGRQLFDYPDKVEHLPFYLIEHRALLPILPDPIYDKPLRLEGLHGIDESPWELTLTFNALLTLQVGQLIDLVLEESYPVQEAVISQIMVREVYGNVFKVQGLDHLQLRNAFERVLDTPLDKVKWRNSSLWLVDMQFRVIYAADQSALPAGSRRLKVSPYPADIKVGDQVVVGQRPDLPMPTGSEERAENDVNGEVLAVDPRNSTVVVTTAEGVWDVIDQWLEGFANGRFADLVYPAPGQTVTNIAPLTTHVDRIRILAMMLSTSSLPPGRRADGYLNCALEAMDFYAEANYQTSNWWDRQIGLARVLAAAAVRLTPTAPEGALRTVVDYLAVQSNVTDDDTLHTGANLADFAAIQAAWACVGWLNTHEVQFVDNLRQITTELEGLSRQVERQGPEHGEGINIDWSFSQHNILNTATQLYQHQLHTGSYGQVYLNSLFASYRSLTGAFALSERAQRLLHAYLAQGVGWQGYAGTIDWHGCGRSISRPAAMTNRALDAQINLLAPSPADPDYAALIELAQRSRTGDESQNQYYVGSRLFWVNDFLAHLNRRFGLWVKTVSERTIGTEIMNGENLMGYYMGCGSYFAVRHGGEYAGLQPLMNWQMIPGTTVEQGPFDWPTSQWSQYFSGSHAMAGGASDGVDAVISMYLTREKIKSAYKTVCVLHEDVVCLGAGIDASEATNVVYTTVNQTWLLTPVEIGYADGRWETLTDTFARDATNIVQVRHDGWAYHFPSALGQRIRVEAVYTSGWWSRINTGGSSTVLHGNRFQLAVQHAQSADQGYVYFMSMDMQRESPPALVWHCAPRAHWVVDQAGEKAVGSVRSIDSLDWVQMGASPVKFRIRAMVAFVARRTADSLWLTLADPEQRHAQLTVEVQEGTGTPTVIEVQFPQGDLRGSSIEIHVPLSSAASV